VKVYQEKEKRVDILINNAGNLLQRFIRVRAVQKKYQVDNGEEKQNVLP